MRSYWQSKDDQNVNNVGPYSHETFSYLILWYCDKKIFWFLSIDFYWTTNIKCWWNWHLQASFMRRSKKHKKTVKLSVFNGLWFCDDSNYALELNNVTRNGVNNVDKLLDNIHWRALARDYIQNETKKID